MSIKSNLHIEIDIDDLKYCKEIKNQLKEVIELIPDNKGLNTVKGFLQKLKLRF